jgi:hypothetical protein
VSQWEMFTHPEKREREGDVLVKRVYRQSARADTVALTQDQL